MATIDLGTVDAVSAAQRLLGGNADCPHTFSAFRLTLGDLTVAFYLTNTQLAGDLAEAVNAVVAKHAKPTAILAEAA